VILVEPAGHPSVGLELPQRITESFRAVQGDAEDLANCPRAGRQFLRSEARSDRGAGSVSLKKVDGLFECLYCGRAVSRSSRRSDLLGGVSCSRTPGSVRNPSSRSAFTNRWLRGSILPVVVR